MLGLSPVAASGGHFIAVRGPLTVTASLVAEHRLQTRRLSSCGSRAELLRGMWDPPRPGLKPVSPALAGRFPTTAPPGKPGAASFYLGSTSEGMGGTEKKRKADKVGGVNGGAESHWGPLRNLVEYASALSSRGVGMASHL